MLVSYHQTPNMCQQPKSDTRNQKLFSQPDVSPDISSVCDLLPKLPFVRTALIYSKSSIAIPDGNQRLLQWSLGSYRPSIPLYHQYHLYFKEQKRRYIPNIGNRACTYYIPIGVCNRYLKTKYELTNDE